MPTKAEIEETLKETESALTEVTEQLESAKAKIEDLETKEGSPDKASLKKIEILTTQNKKLSERVKQLQETAPSPVESQAVSHEEKTLIRDANGNVYECFSWEEISIIFRDQHLTLPNKRVKDIEHYRKVDGNWVRTQ